MVRKRNKESAGLPARWRLRKNGYYYRVPKGMEHMWDGKTEFLLGHTQAEAYRTWAQRLDIYGDAETIGEGLDRYLLEVMPTKAQRTQATELPIVHNLKKVFGDMPIRALKSTDVYKMLDIVGKRSQSQANRHVAVLSHAYSKFIRWGLTDEHPIKGKVEKFGYTPRDRYTEDWELDEFLKMAPDLILAYVPLKIITGLRKGDILSIKLADLKSDGLHAYNSKTKKWQVFRWTDELRQVVDNIRKLPRKVGSIYLFHTRSGQPYVKDDRTTSGFDSIWQRTMRNALAKDPETGEKYTKLERRFTEHDLRAKAGSDMESDELAQQLLNHSSAALTRRVYRRKPNVVTPNTWKKKAD